MDQPSIGRIVHYVDGSSHRAAIVTKINEETSVEPASVDLAIFNPTGPVVFRPSIQFSQAVTAGTWHWPEVL